MTQRGASRRDRRIIVDLIGSPHRTQLQWNTISVSGYYIREAA
jgi:methylmalonyl-CoA mutase N-terminal domain/subunit